MQLSLETIMKERHRVAALETTEAERGQRLGTLALLIFVCSASYGFSMGLQHSLPQAFSAALKVPLLFFCTLAVCFPTLHFISLFFGSRVSLEQNLVILLWGLAVTAVLLAAFAPVALFFLFSGLEYDPLLLMHVAVFALCGAAGLETIRRNVRAAVEAAGGASLSAGPTRLFLGIWMGLYMLVGTQMAYGLSPFVGRESDFVFIYRGKGNFYSHLFETLGQILR